VTGVPRALRSNRLGVAVAACLCHVFSAMACSSPPVDPAIGAHCPTSPEGFTVRFKDVAGPTAAELVGSLGPPQFTGAGPRGVHLVYAWREMSVTFPGRLTDRGELCSFRMLGLWTFIAAASTWTGSTRSLARCGMAGQASTKTCSATRAASDPGRLWQV
jgi:hypothetical protein